jgi:hypothetical protein
MHTPPLFDLRFIIPVESPLRGYDMSRLVPFRPEGYAPGDTEGELPSAFYGKLRRVEGVRCAELKKVADRFEGKDVIHFVVAFLQDDFRAVAASDALRKHHVRAALRSMIRSVETEHEAERLDCVFAMHLESQVPHVHVAMSRYASAGALQMRINRLPAVLFPLN